MDPLALVGSLFVAWIVLVTAVYLGVLGALRAYFGEPSPFDAPERGSTTDE